MKSLYRRYRPLRLDDVIGQEQVTKPLICALKDGKVSHAYLFVGPRGTGKTSVARIFAHEVNGFSYELEDNYVDIIEIDGASNRGIDSIRELREKVIVAPTVGKYKIYIIDEVHMLTKEAFNALLKTLEEPPQHVIFIMATTDAYKVPVTITSRAQTYTFKLAEHKVMFDYLKSVCRKEKIEIDDDALDVIVKRGGGSFRDTLSLLDQISTLSDKKITKPMVISAMGLPEDEKINSLLENYVVGDTDNTVEILRGLMRSGIKPETLAEELIRAIIENPKPEFVSLVSKLVEVKAPFAEARLLIALVNEGVLSPEPTPSTTTEQVSPKDVSPSFNWQEFLDKVRQSSRAIYTQLNAAEHNIDGNILNIYPANDFDKSFLSRDKNKKILVDASGGMKINILDKSLNPNAKKDELFSKMSDIMGGEVISDAGGNPF